MTSSVGESFSSVLPDLRDYRIGQLSEMDGDPVTELAVSIYLRRITDGELPLSSFNSSI